MRDWSNDHVLGALQGLPEPIGSLVRAFPGKPGAADDEWLEKWFVGLARSFGRGRGPDAKKIVATAVGETDISLLSRPPVQEPVRLVSLRTSYFRGFRAPAPPLKLDADLIVLEGRNSSGKTSVSEAIEWVLTGHLSRRESGQHGHPTELANCIANEFRLKGAETFVELGLEVGGAPLTLRRVLRKDYSRVAADTPVSDLFVDGKQLSSREETELLNRLFAGVHPILMQHNLRRFVHDEPHARRQYFERLLQIDELTALIEKAVVGPTRIKQITNPDGGSGLASLRALVAELERAPQGATLAAAMVKLERVKADDLPSQLEKGLLKVFSSYFANDASGATSLAQVRDRLFEAQRLERESRLPVLAALTGARSHEIDRWEPVAVLLASVGLQADKLQGLAAAAASLTQAQQQIARAAGLLADHKLLDLSSHASQVCPLCEDTRLTLSPKRVADLASWAPLANAITESHAVLADLRARSAEHLKSLRRSLTSAIPSLPTRKEVERQLKDANPRVASLAADTFSTAEMLAAGRGTVVTALDSLENVLKQETVTSAQLQESAAAIASSLTSVSAALVHHREIVAALEEAVGTASRDDSAYRLRDRWLELAGLLQH